jgi:hypothetical protein
MIHIKPSQSLLGSSSPLGRPAKGSSAVLPMPFLAAQHRRLSSKARDKNAAPSKRDCEAAVGGQTWSGLWGCSFRSLALFRIFLGLPHVVVQDGARGGDFLNLLNLRVSRQASDHPIRSWGCSKWQHLERCGALVENNLQQRGVMDKSLKPYSLSRLCEYTRGNAHGSRRPTSLHCGDRTYAVLGAECR